MKKFFMMLLLGFCVFGFSARGAWAGEIELLVQKLVEKGVLTAGEAQTIVTETKEEVKAQIAEGKHESLPTWLQTMKLKGDFRLRYQYDKPTGNDESRARIRARVGLEAKINDKMKAGVGIATGRQKDPRSTNVTLGQTGVDTAADQKNTPGSFKNLILDYAYGEFNMTKDITLIGGKFINPLWRPTDFLWDSDLNPEGIALKLTHKISSVDLFMNNMMFILDENISNDSSKYPMVGAVQPGFSYKINDTYGLKGALAAYFFSGVQERATFNGQSTNTKQGSNYKYNYNSLNPSVELSIKEPLGGVVPYAAIFSEGIFNVSKDVESSKSGVAFGVKFGAEKVSVLGDWQAKMIYAKLGQDAWLDILPDSDRYSGKTFMESYETALAYGLGKNTYLELDYYYSQNLSKYASAPTGYRPAHLVQVDWNLKF